MTCHEFENFWQSVFDEPANWLDLTGSRLEAHAATCSRCACKAVRYHTLLSALPRLTKAPAPPASFADRVLDQAGPLPTHPVLVDRNRAPLRLALAASFLVA